MSEKVGKKGNEKADYPFKRNFSKNANITRIKSNIQNTALYSDDEYLNEATGSKFIPEKSDSANVKNENRKKEEKVREIIEEHIIKKETIEYFLTLDKEIQKDIVEESERNYFKMHPEVKDLEIFKKASYSLYLQLIYKELICVIEKNYPELSVESKKRYEILS